MCPDARQLGHCHPRSARVPPVVFEFPSLPNSDGFESEAFEARRCRSAGLWGGALRSSIREPNGSVERRARMLRQAQKEHTLPCSFCAQSRSYNPSFRTYS
jgi:hypothetical protein